MQKRVSVVALTLAIGGLMFFSFGAKADELVLGAKLPAVTANDQDGHAVELQSAGNQGWTLVYFYPKADTSGCTKQACGFRDAIASYKKLGVPGVGLALIDGGKVTSRPRPRSRPPRSSPRSRRSRRRRRRADPRPRARTAGLHLTEGFHLLSWRLYAWK